MKELFNFYDEDQSGYLDYKELSKLLFGHVKSKKNTIEDLQLQKIITSVILFLRKKGFRSVMQLLKIIISLDPDRIGSLNEHNFSVIIAYLSLSSADSE